MPEVLLVCPEPLAHRHPAGVGIRFLEFARALLSEGHSVTLLTPDGGAVEGCRTEAISPRSIQAASGRAGSAIVQGHAANDFFAYAARVPTVVDLYDPYIIENFHYAATLGAQVFQHDHQTLMRSVTQGDFFICASRAQRLFYTGVLLAARRADPSQFGLDPTLRHLIDVVPFGVPPPSVRQRSPESSRILFGGIYDWYSPIMAIDAVAIARLTIPRLALVFTRHPNPEITPQGEAARAVDYVRSRGHEEFVTFEPWVAYAERLPFYDSFAAGLVTFGDSIETELSMRTRIFDYLWAGLPVITSSAPGTDHLVERYAAGSIVTSSDPADYAAAMVSLLTDSERYRSAVAGGFRYAADHSWSRLLEPLLEFCRNPRLAAPVEGTHSSEAHAAGRSSRGGSLMRRLRRIGRLS